MKQWIIRTFPSGRKVILVLLMVSSSQIIADIRTRDWDAEDLTATIQVSGMLVSSPCVLLPESEYQEISLMPIAANTLNNFGDTTLPVDVHVVLDKCPGGLHSLRQYQKNGGNAWYSDQSIVSLRLIGQAAQDDSRFFYVHGTTGLSLRIDDPDGSLIMPGMATNPIPLEQGRNDLILKAQLWRNANPLTYGAWRSVINIEMEYE
ncbi:fimbrial protein [Citrobacter farmeri]|uniref:fimbrial protein n=1 Tax=Citrobacter farmeri TaxID=67824 RepID=UPI002930D7BC|nr:fimbrial protein [Citrobacter farmeri]